MKNQYAECESTENRFEELKPRDLNREEKASVVKLALSILADRHRNRRKLNNSEQTRDFLRLKLADRKHEVFGALFLDNRHRVIEINELFQGTIDAASVHPRVVVQRTLEINAAALVLFHNHPSGVAEPSQSDEALTRRLRDALALVDVRVLDHFVVANGDSVSFAERGLL